MKYIISGSRFIQAVKLINEIKSLVSHQVASKKLTIVQNIFAEALAKIQELEKDEELLLDGHWNNTTAN